MAATTPPRSSPGCRRRSGGAEDDAIYCVAQLERSGFGAWAWKRLRVIVSEDVGLHTAAPGCSPGYTGRGACGRAGVALRDQVGDDVGACLGIPGFTAHRAVSSDGPVVGMTVLAHGVLGAVGSMAAQLAAWRGAGAIGTVRRSSDLGHVDDVVERRLALDEPDPASSIRRLAPEGVHRIVEVSFSDNVDLDAAVAGAEAVIAAYHPRAAADFDFWTMLFANLAMRLLGSDDFPATAKQRQRATSPLQHGRSASHCDRRPLPLQRIAEAHDRVDAGVRKRIVLAVRR